MTARLLQKVSTLLEERAAVRRELALYRRAFDALIVLGPVTSAGIEAGWEYRPGPEAAQALRILLRYRAQAAQAGQTGEQALHD